MSNVQAERDTLLEEVDRKHDALADLYHMLKARPDIRALLGPFEHGVIEGARAALVDPASTLAPAAKMRKALAFYADPKRYEGPNQRAEPGDPFTPSDLPYRMDVVRDGGSIARAALSPSCGNESMGDKP